MDLAKASYVLIGGEAAEWHGVAPAERQVFHTSVSYVCKAYSQLRQMGIPRSSIITIVQLEDYINGLKVAKKIEGLDPRLERGYTYALESTLAVASHLLSEGGATYDGKAVNPFTIWSVLRGEATEATPVVVPKNARFVFFGIYSHGQYYRVYPPEKEGEKEPEIPYNEKPDPILHEWFAYMPYAPEPPHPDILEFIPTATAPKDLSPPTGFYATQLRAIFFQMFSQNPNRPVFGLLNYCKSGGNLDFMKRPAAVTHFGADKWPLWLMSSSSSRHNSLVGGLWESFFSLLLKPGCASLTIEEYYNAVELHYRREFLYELMNLIKATAYPKFEEEESPDDSFHVDIKPLLCHGKKGLPDYDGIQKLQESYRSGKKFGRPILICKPKTEEEVNLAEIVKNCLEFIAAPEEVHGVGSDIANQPISIFFPTKKETNSSILDPLHSPFSSQISSSSSSSSCPSCPSSSSSSSPPSSPSSTSSPEIHPESTLQSTSLQSSSSQSSPSQPSSSQSSSSQSSSSQSSSSQSSPSQSSPSQSSQSSPSQSSPSQSSSSPTPSSSSPSSKSLPPSSSPSSSTSQSSLSSISSPVSPAPSSPQPLEIN